MNFWRFICTGALILLCACTTPAPKNQSTLPEPTNAAPASITVAATAAATAAQPGGPLVFVGTYTFGPGNAKRPEGIFGYRMDPATGALSPVSKAGGPPNPSYLAVDTSGRYLAAVSEWGQRGVGISSYAIDTHSGSLTLINSQPVGGDSPAYVSIHPSGKWVLTANYMGGSASVLPLSEDGKLGERTALVEHQGSGPRKDRQEAPHAHSVIMAPGSSLVLVADLGIDRVMLYDLDEEKGTLAPHAVPALELPPGSGPRHMTFSPDGRFLYVVNELSSSLTAFQFDSAAKTFQEIQAVSLLPADFQGKNTSADLHMTPSGKFLYASNRGHDSLAIFAVDESSGKLTQVGHQSTQGKTPRNFAIDPTGSFLLAANQDSGTIVTFRIDTATGGLTPTGAVTELAMPVCIRFWP